MPKRKYCRTRRLMAVGEMRYRSPLSVLTLGIPALPVDLGSRPAQRKWTVGDYQMASHCVLLCWCIKMHSLKPPRCPIHDKLRRQSQVPPQRTHLHTFEVHTYLPPQYTRSPLLCTFCWQPSFTVLPRRRPLRPGQRPMLEVG